MGMFRLLAALSVKSPNQGSVNKVLYCIVIRCRFYLDPINAVKRPKTLNLSTFKIIHFKEKIPKPFQRNFGLRLTIEEFLKILAHTSFQTNTGFQL